MPVAVSRMLIVAVSMIVVMAEIARREPSADNAAAVTILAANANRVCAAISNDSSAVLYLLVGAGFSVTSIGKE